MSCPKTEHLLQEYFADDLTPLAREEMDRHLGECAICSAELAALLQAREQLGDWQEVQVPHWDRGREWLRNRQQQSQQAPLASTQDPTAGKNWWTLFWQWLPAGASLAMLCILLLNTSINVDDAGISIAFGGGTNSDLDASLASFQQQQQQELQSAVARLEARQERNNRELLQAVVLETRQTTADGMDRLYAYFEEQRLQDMETMRVSYQQLADSDYVTIQSLQDLAQYVSLQGNVR